MVSKQHGLARAPNPYRKQQSTGFNTILPAESQAPCDATSRSGLPSRHAVDSKSHLLEYVLPSDPQTGSYSNVQPPGQSLKSSSFTQDPG